MLWVNWILSNNKDIFKFESMTTWENAIKPSCFNCLPAKLVMDNYPPKETEVLE